MLSIVNRNPKVYTLAPKQKASSDYMTMKFKSYNEAIAFSAKSKIMNPSKPFPRMEFIDGNYIKVWCVTLTMPVIKKDNAPVYKQASISHYEFDSYLKALAFCIAHTDKLPCEPFKRIANSGRGLYEIWCVTLATEIEYLHAA